MNEHHSNLLMYPAAANSAIGAIRSRLAERISLGAPNDDQQICGRKRY